MLWQEAKTLVKETLVDQSNMETISSAPPHGVMDAQSETDPEFTLMSHIIAAGFFPNNQIKSSSKILYKNIGVTTLDCIIWSLVDIREVS